MPKKMLIDAAHPEETRVVVMNGDKLEEFDFESRAKKQLRGNIYLAKVTRVEPSLQAAFVEYGGNRHGFLAFNEIHPDYYQIPHADREALMREAEAEDEEHGHGNGHGGAPAAPAAQAAQPGENGEEEAEAAGGMDDEDELDEEVERRRRRLIRRYKIQEVIKRRQIMLVQVVKEERGTKGAALTTYLSLAGRYCVLMPNTDRGGGISRKITTVTDRKRLRTIVADLDVPGGMGLIVRTAGAKRTKAEIKRDYEYLSRAWSDIRDKTLHSIAPALIYEEEDLVKRAIRDLFDKDIEVVCVEGEAGFRGARDFMRMLMPSQAKKVQAYRDPTPLFVANRIEDRLSAIYSPVAPLRSGGYLVINQTEALVAVDVNSGRATRERNIEATALKTNLEAAEETARQLRLRDLAGLIVIDFIDMDEAKNNRAVEKVLKDALKDDRARIQMGKISSFGLMELSRQRRRTGVLEGTTHSCPTCGGAGRVRSVESSALAALRALQMEALKGVGEVALRVPREVAVYILNEKREFLTRMLHANGLFVRVAIDEALAHAEHAVDRISDVTPEGVVAYAPTPLGDEGAAPKFEPADLADEAAEEIEDETAEDEEDNEGGVEEFGGEERPRAARDDGPRRDEEGARRRGRRRRRGGRRDPEGAPVQAAAAPSQPSAPRPAEGDGEAGSARRRRGRRGGRRGREEAAAGDPYAWSFPAKLNGDDTYQWRGPPEGMGTPPAEMDSAAAAQAPVAASAPVAEAPAPVHEESPVTTTTAGEEIWVELPAQAAPKPPRARRRGRKTEEAAVILEVADPVESALPHLALQPEPVPLAAEPESAPVEILPDPAEISAPPPAPRRGWWRRGA